MTTNSAELPPLPTPEHDLWTKPGFTANQMREYALATLNQQGEQTAPEGWITVKDRLPDYCETVLGFWTPSCGPARGHHFATATFHGGSVWANPEDDEDQYAEPTHWMPLPAAPSTAQPSLVCKQCGADRMQEGCKGDMLICAIRGAAQKDG